MARRSPPSPGSRPPSDSGPSGDRGNAGPQAGMSILSWTAFKAKGTTELAAGRAVELAAPGSRLAARVIDVFLMVLLWVIIFIIWSLALGIPGSDASDSEANPLASAGIVFSFIFVGIAYEMLPTAKSGRTLGRMVAGTLVVRAADGAVPGHSASLRRWGLPSLFCLAVFFVNLIDVPGSDIFSLLLASIAAIVYMSLTWDPRRQGLHDKVAGTIVVMRAGSFAKSRS